MYIHCLSQMLYQPPSFSLLSIQTDIVQLHQRVNIIAFGILYTCVLLLLMHMPSLLMHPYLHKESSITRQLCFQVAQFTTMHFTYTVTFQEITTLCIHHVALICLYTEYTCASERTVTLYSPYLTLLTTRIYTYLLILSTWFIFVYSKVNAMTSTVNVC